MSKKGELRITAKLAGRDNVYTVEVEVYEGFFSGWSTVKRWKAENGRTPESAIQTARNYIEEAGVLKFGVIK